MSPTMDNQEDHPESFGLSRRTSVAPTVASTSAPIEVGDQLKQHNNDSNSEHTITEEKPKRKNNLWVTFSGLQIALFLAALDR